MTLLRHRVAHPADVPELLELLARPGDGYAPSPRAGLGPLIACLLQERAICAPILEERSGVASGRAGSIQGSAITGFVELEQGRAWLERPPSHFIDLVFSREEANEPVLLRPDRIAACNARDGMALVFLAFAMAIDPNDSTSSLRIGMMLDGFRLFHAGYHCPLAIHPPPTSMRGRQSIVDLGLRPAGDGANVWFLDSTRLDQAPYNPFVVLRRASPPRFGFSPSEQDTLLHALLGYTDAEIARELRVGLETIRKRWRRIFERVTDHPELQLFRASHAGANEARRGPEKRGALLQYLAGHPEELRLHAGSA